MTQRIRNCSFVLPPSPARWLIYAFVVSHFLVLVVAYSGNWQKSINKDRLLSYLKPYLIGLNWDLELFPVEWNRVAPDEGCARVVMKTADGEAYVALSSNSGRVDRQRERQLVGLMNFMALNANDDGLSLLLVSALRHAERTQNKSFVSVSVEQRQYGTVEYSTVYEARKIILDGSVALLPVLEGQRTVHSLVSATNTRGVSAAEGAK